MSKPTNNITNPIIDLTGGPISKRRRVHVSKPTNNITNPIIDLTGGPISKRRSVHVLELLTGKRSPHLRRWVNKRSRKDYAGPRVADIGPLVDRISEFVPHTTSCKPQEQCRRKPSGTHIRNTGRECLLNSVLPTPSEGTQLACWSSGWKEYIKSTRFNHKARILSKHNRDYDPDATIDSLAESIMNDYRAMMNQSRGPLTPYFREEVVLALIPNYEVAVYNNLLEIDARWFYNPQFLARIANVLITRAKTEEGENYSIRDYTRRFVKMVTNYLHSKYGTDNDYVKSYTSFVKSTISRIPNIDTVNREKLLHIFMNLTKFFMYPFYFDGFA